MQMGHMLRAEVLCVQCVAKKAQQGDRQVPQQGGSVRRRCVLCLAAAWIGGLGLGLCGACGDNQLARRHCGSV